MDELANRLGKLFAGGVYTAESQILFFVGLFILATALVFIGLKWWLEADGKGD